MKITTVSYLALAFSGLAWWGIGCEPALVVGEWPCASAPLVDFAGTDAALPPAPEVPIAVPWTADFEDGFCGYTQARGFCYQDPDALYAISTIEVHSGRRAAAFSITSDATKDGKQARCVREGIMPSAAYYGAWFYLPTVPMEIENWNLMHFQGADLDGGAGLHGLWDVSLNRSADGGLSLRVFDFFDGAYRSASAGLGQVPIASWFRLDFYLRRAGDDTGEIALYLDGRVVLQASDLITDDSIWGQWYVGNLAASLTPSDSTVYVDDVTIRQTL